MKGCDIVFFFAAISDIQESLDNLKIHEVNIIRTFRKACINNILKKLVFASTIYVYVNMEASIGFLNKLQKN